MGWGCRWDCGRHGGWGGVVRWRCVRDWCYAMLMGMFKNFDDGLNALSVSTANRKIIRYTCEKVIQCFLL